MVLAFVRSKPSLLLSANHQQRGVTPRCWAWPQQKQQQTCHQLGRQRWSSRGPIPLRVAQPLSDTLTDTAVTAPEDAVQELLIDELPAVEVPPDVLVEFDHRLEEDLQSVAVTLTAVTGVIIFWRGVWSLLDYFLGDSIFGDICCIIAGLTIVLGIRLAGVKVSSTFWPPS